MNNNTTNYAFSAIEQYRELILQDAKVELPGHDGLDMLIRKPGYLVPTPENARQAAVVLLIHTSQGYPSILFIQRSDHDHQDKHRGQIAFPGGKLEYGESLKECAFREMGEEIGFCLPIDHPTGKLTPLYVSVSNFLIHPFVVFQDTLPDLRPNPEEVAAVIDSPLTDLNNRYAIRRKDIHVRNMTLPDVPYYDLQGKTLWGATALIFSEFLQLIRTNTAP